MQLELMRQQHDKSRRLEQEEQAARAASDIDKELPRLGGAS
jgi:hypothetical protein